MRNIVIKEVGQRHDTAKYCYSVQFGCKTFVFIDKEEMKAELNKYIDNPAAYENEWYEKHEKLENHPTPVNTSGLLEYHPSEDQLAPMPVEGPTDRI